MSTPLSPRSLSSLNLGSPASNHLKLAASPLKTSSISPCSTTTSSPFQTDVATNITSNPSTNLDPARSFASPEKDFQIYTEPTQDEAQQPMQTPSQISPSKVPLPPSSPFDAHNEVDDDFYIDNRSIISDDTAFSTFSAIPDLTTFAARGSQPGLGVFRSPQKGALGSVSRSHFDPPSKFTDGTPQQTPSQSVFMTPATSRRRQAEQASRAASPTPRSSRLANARDDDTTSLLLDFTGTIDSASMNRLSPTKSSTEPNLLSYINNQRIPSPSKATPRPNKNSLMNLLDFDLPPQPTPRSIPSITVRELESLKSTYLSEISSLKASLSGRDAELMSLKRAVSDAERRVGEAQEKEREEQSACEHAQAQRGEWEKKGKELESLLRKVREEFILGEKEKEDLSIKLEESNRAKEEAQLKVAERAMITANDFDPSVTGSNDVLISHMVSQQLDEKMENLARELHAVYKKKHEGKVATLKKTYEARAEKKCQEMQHKLDDLMKQTEELQAAKDASLSMELAMRRQQESDDSITETQQQKAQIDGLRQEMSSIQNSHAQLIKELESERIEKGELVAAVDEMLALQSEVGAPTAIEDFRKSISRPVSGLKGPGFSGSRIGYAGSSLQSRGIPTTSASGKSRMMSNIERMGLGKTAE